MSDGIIQVSVEAAALCGPGLPDWEASCPVLQGIAPYHTASVVLEAPMRLSAAERRRAIPSVRLALGVGSEAVTRSGIAAGALTAVFASSGADGETIGAVLAALAIPSREVSPTRFHNSVHNAASGYWGIAMQSREPVTSVSCYDASFAAGLLEAGVQAVTGGRPVLLVAYDLPYPDPLEAVRPIHESFGVALVLAPVTSPAAIGSLRLRWMPATGTDLSTCEDPGLEALRRGNPAARALPLLSRLARRSTGRVWLEHSRGVLDIDVVPC